MKNISLEIRVGIFLCGGFALTVVPWFLFHPFNTPKLLDDAWSAVSGVENYGEECTISVKDITDMAGGHSAQGRDIQDLLRELSVRVTSHIRQKDNKVYRIFKNSSPLSATDGEHEKTELVFETIYDNGTEYARYDTVGPWISFSEKLLSESGEYIQKMFRDQFYYSLDDIKKESVYFSRATTDTNNEKLFYFRGEQTQKSLDTSRELFQYPIGKYTVIGEYADVVIDGEKRTVLKTVLYTLFDYVDESDTSIHLTIPVYQECVPVREKDLEVYAPTNSIEVVMEQMRNYILFKIIPKVQ